MEDNRYKKVNTSVCMGDTEYRNVRLTESAYGQLKRRKREGESFSDTVERIAGERSLLDLVGILTEEEGEAVRDAIKERDDASRDRLDRIAERLSQ